MNFPDKHNLDIHMYSFDEILALFNLTYNISIEDMKRAKMKVLMSHPDKSKLSQEFFLFYKKAYEIVYNYYENSQKQNKDVPMEEINYEPVNNNGLNKSANKKITSVIHDMKPKEFNEKFNELFNNNMANQQKSRNDWFSNEEPVLTVDQTVTKSNMNAIMEDIKRKNQGVVKYQGVQDMYSSRGNNFYDDDDQDNADQYVCSDPFGKLKFDDLRKVHKDQTVFSVGETDFQNMKTYSNMEQYNNARGAQDLTPLEKSKASSLLEEQERIMKERMARKMHESSLRTNLYEEKNKQILASFLQLENKQPHSR